MFGAQYPHRLILFRYLRAAVDGLDVVLSEELRCIEPCRIPFSLLHLPQTGRLVSLRDVFGSALGVDLRELECDGCENLGGIGVWIMSGLLEELGDLGDL